MDLVKRFKIYIPFSRSVMQKLLSYKINFFAFTAGGIIQTFAIFYLWQAVFHNSGQQVLEGFTVETMSIYIIISAVTTRIVGAGVDGTIGNEVKQGTIAMNLIKPVNYQVRLLFMAIGGNLHQMLFVALPLWIGIELYRVFYLQIAFPELITFFYYFLSLILSFLILFFFNFCFGMSAFFVTNLWGSSFLKNILITFLSGEWIPIVFFPIWAQNIFEFLPFASMNYIPVMIYLNKMEDQEIMKALGTQLLWVIILFLISRYIWKKAITKLTILGG